MVISPNGYIAREDGSEDWLPDEGWDEFVDLAKELNNIVMGRETYTQVTNRYEEYNFDNVPCEYKLIVTRNRDFQAPDRYVVVHSPEEAIKYLQVQGVETAFLIGGGKLNSEFIKKGLVDQLQLTVNPYLIGKGRPFLAPDDFEMPLTFVESSELPGGRAKLKYIVQKDK